jgi:hypothetical protein
LRNLDIEASQLGENGAFVCLAGLVADEMLSPSCRCPVVLESSWASSAAGWWPSLVTEWTGAGTPAGPPVADARLTARVRRPTLGNPLVHQTRSGEAMKKVLTISVVALLLFFLISQPTQSAALVQSLLGGLRNAAESILMFVQNVFS